MDKEDSIFLLKEIGTVIVNIKDIAVSKGFTNCNQIVTRTGLHYKVVNRYWNGDITKPDKHILAIFCYIFQCDIYEIIKYIPPKL